MDGYLEALRNLAKNKINGAKILKEVLEFDILASIRDRGNLILMIVIAFSIYCNIIRDRQKLLPFYGVSKRVRFQLRILDSNFEFWIEFSNFGFQQRMNILPILVYSNSRLRYK